jgi:carbon-monoxide dehydrogenase medium subunit
MLGALTIHQPATVAEATDLRARLGEDAAVYAGGTELLLVMKEGLGRWPHLIDVKGVAELHELADGGGTLRIGAAVTHRQLERSALVRGRVPLLAEVEREVANVRVRNVGTLGGNLCFAEPHSDPATALLVHDARVVLAGPRAPRVLPIAGFVVGSYETALGLDEVLVRVEVPAPPAGAAGAYLKFGFHERPTVGVAVLLVPSGDAVGEARVAVGCIGPVPVRLAQVEASLAGAPLAALAVLATTGPARDGGARAALRGNLAALDVVSDLHGTGEYKRHVAGVLVARALAAAAARARSRS